MENIRLVVWDLDDTFWHGTLTEGGIAYAQRHHEIVVALARRGIMSSICSNNHYGQVAALLRKTGIWDYFILPDIAWGPKGPRLAALIEAVQLRPQTVLFIDDNPMNRAEASFYVPGLQTAPESFIPEMLGDPRFAGKDDAKLSRLRQYKVLERRRADAEAAGTDNLSFLRASDIRVAIDYDIEGRLDRVVELINRTNQLNFTKRRLPEDPERARETLRQALASYYAFAGLVRVTDRYGDYGDVGFFLSHGGGSQHLLHHFCFSCRILNMGVETWVYRWLGRPYLNTTGEVLSDPVNDPREIDWITRDDGVPRANGDGASAAKPLGRLVLRGGCDMTALSHYLTDLAGEVHVEHHMIRDDRAILTDHTALLRLALDGVSPAAHASLCALGHDPADWTSAVTLPAQPGRRAVWLLSFWMDSFAMLYRHRELGLRVPFALAKEPHATEDVTRRDDAYLAQFMTTEQHRSALAALRRDYVATGTSDEGFVRGTLRALAGRAGPQTLIVILLGPESWTNPATGKTTPEPAQAEMNRWIRAELGDEENVVLLDPLAFGGGEQQLADNALHFHRLFYHRLGTAIHDIVLDFTRDGAARKPAPHASTIGQAAKRGLWRQHVGALLSRLGYN